MTVNLTNMLTKCQAPSQTPHETPSRSSKNAKRTKRTNSLATSQAPISKIISPAAQLQDGANDLLKCARVAPFFLQGNREEQWHVSGSADLFDEPSIYGPGSSRRPMRKFTLKFFPPVAFSSCDAYSKLPIFVICVTRMKTRSLNLHHDVSVDPVVT